MEKNRPREFSQELSWFLSVLLHALLLLGAHYLPLKQANVNTSSYGITLSFVQSYQQPTVPSVIETLAAVQPPQAELDSQQILEKAAPKETIGSKIQDESNTVSQLEVDKKEAIDERGFYKNSSGKQTSTFLELIGWVWDTVPEPHDNTDETGKIVFEIKIDELGEVVAVKTLEKTVSPLVEKSYKDAVAGLTFSKTANNTAYNPISVGKVTFILRTK